MKVLVTGFGPFPGVPRNPAGVAALRLARLRRPALADIERHSLILPTEWAAVPSLVRTLERLRPDAVLMLGVAARRRRLCVERVAQPACRGPDAAKRQPPARRLAGGNSLRARANAVRCRHALVLAGMDAVLSRDAGQYLCNASYHAALTWAGAGVPVLFLHLPGRGPQSRVDSGRLDFALSQALLALSRGR